MAVPLGLEIRVGNINRGLPYPVKVHLPSIAEPENRESARASGPDLDILVPACSERHTALGLFMDAWSQLEQYLIMLFSSLLGVEVKFGEAIMSTMGTKQISDAIAGLAMVKLSKEEAKILINLTERLVKLNSKRNILVHGHWILEANIIVRRGEAVLVSQFLRVTTPLNPDEEKAMADPRNQKQRVRYSFNLKRIAGATQDTDRLKLDFSQFAESTGMKIVFPAAPINPTLI